MNAPKISVIIPTYNRERVIAQTLQSVLDQEYPALEVLVCDDGSTDATVAIAQEFGAPVQILPLEKNSGLPAVGRNRGMRAATGEYIAFLDSDDLWLPGKLFKQRAWFRAHPGCGMVHSYVELMDDDNQMLGIRHEGQMPDEVDLLPALLQHCFISISSVMVAREVLEKIGFMSEDPFYRAREDYEWFLRVARDCQIGLIPEVLARYRKSPTSISSDERTWKLRPEDAPMHQRIFSRPELWTGRVGKAEVRSIFVEAYLSNTQYWRDHNQPARALWNARQALAAGPLTARAWVEILKSFGRTWFPVKR